MTIAGLTPEEWATDTLTTIKAGEDAHKIITLLVERIAAQSCHEMAQQVIQPHNKRLATMYAEAVAARKQRVS